MVRYTNGKHDIHNVTAATTIADTHNVWEEETGILGSC